MNKNLSLIFLVLIIFSGCSKIEIFEKTDATEESEPNDESYRADEITECINYTGRIAKPDKNRSDKDLFKIWKPAGTLITFEFETDAEGFMPYIGHSDNLAHAQFVIIDSPAKFRAEFITSVDGWQYFEIGDRRNTSDDEEKVGDFTYFFRIMSSHICENDYQGTLVEGDVLSREFMNGKSSVDILSMDVPETGMYQLRVVSEEMESDKFSFVFNCDYGRVTAGNDDEDYYSNLMDPLIYSKLESNLKYYAVTGRLLTDLRSSGKEKFDLYLFKQPQEKELEPNNMYNYANIFSSDSISGELSSEPVTVLGEKTDDNDWFKISVHEGEVVDFIIETENGNPFNAEIWYGSYNETGSTILPLRFSRLSESGKYRMNMMAPFSGTLYFLLNGRDVPYTVQKFDGGQPETLLSFDGRIFAEVKSEDCEWKFFKWTMPDDADDFEMTLSSASGGAGAHIFSADRKPFLFLNPENENRFVFHRYEKTQALYFGLYLGECVEGNDEFIDLKILKRQNDLTKWEDGTQDGKVPFRKSGSYQGFFDTDNLFVENYFFIEVPHDGKMQLVTWPDRETTDFDIDTVVTLFNEDGEMLDENDDAAGFINYNQYSFLEKEVEKGEKYIVKVSPFMTESSHIPSMKITGYYILDIIIK